MTKFKFTFYCIASALFLHGCSEILEPVSLFAKKQSIGTETVQEEFEINIKSLTFDTAKKANNAHYPRRMKLTGSGPNANVLDEKDFLKTNLPVSSSSPNYLLGIGDMISLKLLFEYKTEIAQWPSVSKETEYLLGAGDELVFTQSNDSNQDISITYDDSQMITSKDIDALIQTRGVIGSNGNILLFGLGNILAANRSLDDVRTEVRNILIRNGLAPNFQLEISQFRSQKAFIITGDNKSVIKSLNSLPITLKEIALVAGLTESQENFARVKLTRNEQEFRYTASQLFDLTAPEITIQDNDQIEIQISSREPKAIPSVVDLKGNILIEGLGKIYALNRNIDDIYEEIKSNLIKKGFKPNFQLELTGFVSKKAYLIQKNVGSTIVPLTSSNITLRELILGNKAFDNSTGNLSIITLKRNGQVFRMTEEQILDPTTQDIWIIDKDQIEVESLTYKLGQVFALSGAGSAQVVSISPSKRETLADILFSQSGALNNLLAKRSEVYLLRGQNPSIAYHLDAQNVSRILVAAQTELRPNDIVYVADRPIISFSRTLGEILPLRILLRDLDNGNIP
jgi:protein involved in polysaccharide export with SLBB domain